MKHQVAFCGLVLALAYFSHATQAGETMEFGEEFVGLKAEVLNPPKEDCERYSQKGDLLSVHYKGYLASDMTMFDSSYDKGKGDPEIFTLGTLEKIAAWDLALVNMCVGEERKLIVPAVYGFGEYGSRDGKVGGNEDLIYEIKLIKIQDGVVPGPIEAFTKIDTDNDGYLTMEEVSEFIRIQEEYHEIQAAEEEEHNAMVADIFKVQDTDRDGSLSLAEFSVHDEL